MEGVKPTGWPQVTWEQIADRLEVCLHWPLSRRMLFRAFHVLYEIICIDCTVVILCVASKAICDLISRACSLPTDIDVQWFVQLWQVT